MLAIQIFGVGKYYDDDRPIESNENTCYCCFDLLFMTFRLQHMRLFGVF